MQFVYELHEKKKIADKHNFHPYFSAGCVTSTTWPTCHFWLWLATTTAPSRGS
jgi:hypothetical protein